MAASGGRRFAAASGRTALVLAMTLVPLACGQGQGGSPPATASPGTPGLRSATPSASGKPATPTAASGEFSARIQRVDRGQVRHSWRPGCPVPLSGLRRVQLTHWGFDHKPHTGTLVVNARAAGDMVKTFRRLFRDHYPIRRMEPVDKYKGSDFDSIEADNTSAFNCRRATGSSTWSQHAFGLAIDVNPCENPYVPAGGSSEHKRCVKYDNRRLRLPGMIHEGDRVVRAFDAIGWGWGGNWSGTKDYQHFSSSGR